MADGYINQVTLPDSTKYTFVDNTLYVYSGHCATAGNVAIKEVTCPDHFALRKGATIFVTFDNTNSVTAANLQLKVNSGDAKPLKHAYNATESNLPGVGYLRANQTYQFYYDGTNWVTLLDYNIVTSWAAGQAVHTDLGTASTSTTINGGISGSIPIGVTGTLPVRNGGTGSTSFTANSLIISGNSTTAALTTRGITNNTSNAAITTGTNIPTLNTIYNGLVVVNDSAQTRATTIYAPTTPGTTNQILVATSTGIPVWKSTNNGALYATSSGGSATFGTLPVPQGGIGITSVTKNAILAGNASSVTGAISPIATQSGAFYATTANGTATFGTLPVKQGGTGITSVTKNAILAGNASSTAGPITPIATQSGAFYSTTANGVAQFGTLPVQQGGTGITSIAKNAILAGNTSSTAGPVIPIATGSGALYATAANGAAQFGTLPIAQGGTNATSVNAFGVVYGNASGTSLSSTTAGTLGYLLESGGGSTIPNWIIATPSSTASSIVKRDEYGDFSANSITANLHGNADTATEAATVTLAINATTGTAPILFGPVDSTTADAANALYYNTDKFYVDPGTGELTAIKVWNAVWSE